MIIVISPSKTLGRINHNSIPDTSRPIFLDKSKIIVDRLRKLNVDELMKLMSISTPLARLNFERYLQWQTPFNEQNSIPAIFTFKGDVYEGISASDFTVDDLNFAQNHLRILSGLYGVIRPLDLMQPYRLEMGTKIDVAKAKNLYDYWQKSLNQHFNELISKDNEQVLVNLASNEYSKVLDLKAIKGSIITPIFKEQKGNTYKTIAIYAKRARGLMTRFVIKNRIEKVEHLKTFSEEGYVFSIEQTKNDTWVFIR
jgi:cytoplasmic iron level regulating protein YaaA (DUF328/UPF0246 family)